MHLQEDTSWWDALIIRAFWSLHTMKNLNHANQQSRSYWVAVVEL